MRRFLASYCVRCYIVVLTCDHIALDSTQSLISKLISESIVFGEKRNKTLFNCVAPRRELPHRKKWMEECDRMQRCEGPALNLRWAEDTKEDTVCHRVSRHAYVSKVCMCVWIRVFWVETFPPSLMTLASVGLGSENCLQVCMRGA